MYLHIGQDTVLNTNEIIGVFDLDNASQAKDTRNLLHRCEQENLIHSMNDTLPRSFVILDSGQVYLTPVSSGTIARRSMNQSNIQTED